MFVVKFMTCFGILVYLEGGLEWFRKKCGLIRRSFHLSIPTENFLIKRALLYIPFFFRISLYLPSSRTLCRSIDFSDNVGSYTKLKVTNNIQL